MQSLGSECQAPTPPKMLCLGFRSDLITSVKSAHLVEHSVISSLKCLKSVRLYLHSNDRPHLVLLRAYLKFSSSCSLLSTSIHLFYSPPKLQQP